MNMIQIDITDIPPERVKKAIDILTGNDAVVDVSINAMAEAVTGLTEELAELRSQVYKAGEDIIVDKIQADIVDSDDVDENYDHNLYQQTVKEVNDLFEFAPQHKDAYISEIRKITGDDEVRPGKADHIYHEIRRWVINAKQASW